MLVGILSAEFLTAITLWSTLPWVASGESARRLAMGKVENFPPG